MIVMLGSKYGNKRVEEDGYTFDSKAERAEYRRLKLRQLAGGITDLSVHPKFTIVVNNVKVCTYIGDFRHIEADTGEVVITDVKSRASLTPVYRLKKKLMFACLGITITEVMT